MTYLLGDVELTPHDGDLQLGSVRIIMLGGKRDAPR